MRFLLLMGLPFLLAAAAPAPGGTVAFQVIDETDPQEISEDTVVFIDGHQVAHFVLDKHHTAIIADVSLPAAAQYDYRFVRANYRGTAGRARGGAGGGWRCHAQGCRG